MPKLAAVACLTWTPTNMQTINIKCINQYKCYLGSCKTAFKKSFDHSKHKNDADQKNFGQLKNPMEHQKFTENNQNIPFLQIKQ